MTCSIANDTNDILETIDLYDININGSEHNLTLLTGTEETYFSVFNFNLLFVAQNVKLTSLIANSSSQNYNDCFHKLYFSLACSYSSLRCVSHFKKNEL
jgi:hypothetical protein